MPPIENNDNNENGAGPVIAIVVVLAMIILGGLYFWGERSNMDTYGAPSIEQTVESISTQSSSDEVSDIEADLNDTSVEDLGSELDSI